MLKDGTGPVLGSHGGEQASPACASAGHPGTGSPCPPLLAHRCGGMAGEDEHTSNHCSAHTDTLHYGHKKAQAQPLVLQPHSCPVPAASTATTATLTQ